MIDGLNPDAATPATPVGDDDLQAWVDRRLPPGRRDAVEAYLAAHPDVAARLNRYVVQHTGLATALQPKFEEPMPARLRIDTLLARRRGRMTGYLAKAASFMLVAGLGAVAGWAAHGWTSQGTQLGTATANAVAAYETFTVEARHPVEVRADEGAHLMQWISNRLERPITPPDLSPLGWRLMGGRILPTAHAPAAQLMYDDDRGTRLTVYVQPMGIEGEEFRYTQDGDIRTIVWAERRLALAVTGRTSDAVLMAVARRVHDAVGAVGPK